MIDADGSGSSDTCASPLIGVERLIGATEWPYLNDKRAILSEYAGGNNVVCKEAVVSMLAGMALTGVWQGAMWWTAGPGATLAQNFSMEPPSGIAFTDHFPLISGFA